LWVSATPQRRLEIMRDARLGAFGGLVLALFLILKVLAAGSLPAPAFFGGQPSLVQPLVDLPLVTATVCARWLILPLGRQRGARPGGLGADFALGLSPAGLVAPALFLAAVTALGGARALMAVIAAHI